MATRSRPLDYFLVSGVVEPAGRGAAALRHDEPLEGSGRAAESGEGYGAHVDGDLVRRRREVEQGEDAPFAQGVEGLVDPGVGKRAEAAGGEELLVVHRYPNVADILGDGDHEAEVRRNRVLLRVQYNYYYFTMQRQSVWH